jgi:hypothetical protein
MANNIICIPNPFINSASIEFTVLIPGWIRLSVFDTFGREVEMLINEFRNPEHLKLNFDASQYPPGFYYFTLLINNKVFTGKMLLIK